MELDEFGDDDLDGLPDSTLCKLEEYTKIATQKWRGTASKAAEEAKQVPRNGIEHGKNTTTGAWRPPRSHVTGAQPLNDAKALSSIYGFDDENVIDLDQRSTIIQPVSSLPTRYRDAKTPVPPSHYWPKPPLDPETAAAFAAADAELAAGAPVQWVSNPAHGSGGMDVQSLQARIAELEASEQRLRQSEQQARDALTTKQGEIAIVRANQEKTAREYERRLSLMQKIHAEEKLKQKAELEASKKEQERMDTNNRFLQHDLVEEAERSKKLAEAKIPRSATAGDPRQTPKKVRTAHGDGFDSEEVYRVSPSKSKERSLEQTPKRKVKRKRAAQDSPVRPLSFDQPGQPVYSEESLGTAMQNEKNQIFANQQREQLEFIQRMLNHVPVNGTDRTLEALTRHAFPSEPHKSIAAIVTDCIASGDGRQEDSHLPLRLSRVLLQAWKQCLSEKHYGPFGLILDLLRAALRFELSSVVSQLVEHAVPLCIQTIDRVAIPITRVSARAKFVPIMSAAELEQLVKQVDVDEVLDFLRELCESASISSQHIEAFWCTMELEFTLTILHKALPISQIMMTLRILSTSILETNFGPISPNPDLQPNLEQNIIDRLTNLLFERPEVPAGEPAYAEEEILDLRLSVLELFKSLCCKPGVGGLRLAQHPTAIARLIIFLHEQINRLYASRPSIGRDPGELPPDRPLFIHDLIAKTINMTVMILHYLLKTYDSVSPFQPKIKALRGGWHRFIVAMTRIAFAEQLVLDAGIENQAIEGAHAILDTILSPEEGEAVIAAVETPRGTRSSTSGIKTGDTTEKATQWDYEAVAMDDAG